jgi:hypothetical protein
MATYYARSTGGNWNSSSSWSTVSSASSTNAGTFPGAADTTILDSGSGNITINVLSASLTLNCTGYTGTLRFQANFQLGGALSLGSGMTITADLTTRSLSLSTATITSNSVHLPITITVNTSPTITLADDLDCLNTAANFFGTFVSSTTTTRYFKVRGNLTINGACASNATNTVVFQYTGTGTYTSGGSSMNVPFEINTSGTLSFAVATHNFGNSNLNYSWSFKYTLGTVISTGSTISVSGSVATYKIDSNILTFDTIVTSLNVEFLSTLRTTTLVVPYNTSGVHVLSGNYGFICDYLEFNKSGTLGVYRNLTLTAGNTYIVNKLISNFPTPNGSLASPSIQSSHASNKVNLTLNGGSSLVRCNMTRINASGGVIINTIGVITDCFNVGTSTQNVLI